MREQTRAGLPARGYSSERLSGTAAWDDAITQGRLMAGAENGRAHAPTERHDVINEWVMTDEIRGYHGRVLS